MKPYTAAGAFCGTLIVVAGVVSVLTALDPAAIRICTEVFPKDASALPPKKGAALLACQWNKRTVTVKFLGGDPVVQAKVQKYALQWNQYSGVKFAFTNAPTADIRVTFELGKGSESRIGSCQSDLPPEAPTMNFGWLYPTTDDGEYSRVVLHEFGHALGLIHEHQSPASPFAWDRNAVYEYYERTQHWTREQTDQNVINKWTASETNYTAYDPQSIMVYAIPRALTNGYETPWNTTLSATDKAFIAHVYP